MKQSSNIDSVTVFGWGDSKHIAYNLDVDDVEMYLQDTADAPPADPAFEGEE